MTRKPADKKPASGYDFERIEKIGRVTLLRHKNQTYYARYWDKNLKKPVTLTLETKVKKVAIPKASELDKILRGLLNSAVPYLDKNRPQETLETAFELGTALSEGSEQHHEALKRFYRYFLEWRDKHRPSLQQWGDLSRTDIEAYVAHLVRSKRTYWTINAYLRPFSLAQKAMQQKHPNVFQPIDLKGLLPKQKDEPLKFLCPAQAVAFYEWAAKQKRRTLKQVALVFALGAFNGLRITEILRLTPSDFDGANLTIRHSKTDAGCRVIPMTQRAIDAWNAYLQSSKVQPGPQERIISLKKYNQLSTYITDAYKDASKALKIPDLARVNPHEGMRKTFCNILNDADISNRYQDAILGHAPSEARMRSAHYATFRVRPNDLDHIKANGLKRLRLAIEIVNDYLAKNLANEDGKELQSADVLDLHSPAR